METKAKIKEINSRRKPTKGFSESEITESSIKTAKTITKNDAIAMFDVNKIYYNYQITSSFEAQTFSFDSSYSTEDPNFEV